MEPATVGAIAGELFKHWGITALFLLCLFSMGGISVAQVVQIRRWQPQTKEISTLLRSNIDVLKEIAQKLDTQHVTCTRHYEFAQRQIDGMASIGQELRSVVDAISDSDKTRNAEVMQLMTVIASRHTT
jgi:hypothetical protein